jgi:integrase
VTSQIGRLKYEEARDDLLAFHKVNGRDTEKLEARIKKHLTPYFAGVKMANISPATINGYVAKRLKDTSTPANATVNRELGWLKQMFRLAVDAGKLMTRPKITMLREDNVRTGFFERHHFDAMLPHIHDELQPVVKFAYITGWRKGEVLTLEWRQVDMQAGVVRLEPGTTKNGKGREFPFTRELRALLEGRQHADHERLKKQGVVVPWVFYRMVAKGRRGKKSPRPIISYLKAFKTACEKAGCPARLPHDFRRSAVRNLTRAGVPQSVAMKMTGHKTDSVFRRYDIVSPDDLRIAAEPLDQACVQEKRG